MPDIGITPGAATISFSGVSGYVLMTVASGSGDAIFQGASGNILQISNSDAAVIALSTLTIAHAFSATSNAVFSLPSISPPVTQTTFVLLDDNNRIRKTTVTGPLSSFAGSGSPGISGISGSPGLPGFSGQPGVSGFSGQPGVSGLPGSPGLPGLPGISGQPGLAGTTGVSGVSGLPGISGQPGLVGTPGISGLPGSTGQPGTIGQPGSIGTPGISGLPGSTGQPGVSGSSGQPGVSGLPGSTGPIGVPGVPGLAGTAAASGQPGFPGLPGLPGFSGQPGSLGQPGLPGTIGTPGLLGESGIPGNASNTNILQPELWMINTSSSQVTGGLIPFNSVSNSNFNTITIKPGPYNSDTFVWTGKGQGTGASQDAGWTTSIFLVSADKPYRYSCWYKWTSGSGVGNFYLAPNAINDLTGSINNNPFFVNTLNLSAALQKNKWYLFVGYVWPWNTSRTTSTGLGGIYDPNITTIVTAGTDYKWISAGINTAKAKTYLGLTTDINTIVYFAEPRVEVLDGRELSIPVLLGTLPPGIPGSTGTPGTPGNAGTPGSIGTPGTLGLPGMPGLTGTSGSPGISGVPGSAGPVGTPGTPGTPGLTGTSGFPGNPGISGTPGSSAQLITGTGSPEGVVTASPLAFYLDTTSTANPVVYIKVTGSGNTGWRELIA